MPKREEKGRAATSLQCQRTNWLEMEGQVSRHVTGWQLVGGGSLPLMNTKRINHNVNMLHGKPTAAVPVCLCPILPSLSHPVVYHRAALSCITIFSPPLSPQLVSLSWPPATIKFPRGNAVRGERRFPSQFDLRRNFATV